MQKSNILADPEKRILVYTYLCAEVEDAESEIEILTKRRQALDSNLSLEIESLRSTAKAYRTALPSTNQRLNRLAQNAFHTDAFANIVGLRAMKDSLDILESRIDYLSSCINFANKTKSELERLYPDLTSYSKQACCQET